MGAVVQTMRLTNTDGGHCSEFDVACDMVAGGTHQTSTFKHLLHHVPKACVLALKTFISRVFSHVMTACLRAVSVAYCLPGRCFLRGPNEGKSLGPILSTRLVTVVIDHTLYSPYLACSDFCLYVPLKKHLACKQFATNADVKQAVTFWLQTPDTSFFCAQIQALMWQWDK